MTTSRSLGRLPKDIHARQRLRDAQALETRAVAAVYTARTAVDKATGQLTRAEAALRGALRGLVEVSGTSRAAALIDIPFAELRRTLATSETRADGTPRT